MKIKILIYILTVLSCFGISAEERKYEEETIRNLKKEYIYRVAPEKKDEPKEEEEKSADIDFPMSNIMVALFVVIVAAFLIALFMRMKGTKISLLESKDEIEAEEVVDEYTSKSELELALEKALSDKDYRLAVRVIFLLALQSLENRNYIVIEKSKTIPQYLYELDGKKERSELNDLAYLFNYAWYGGFEVDQESYTKANQFYQKISGAK